MTKNDQYYNNLVWFWNVSDPDQDLDYILSLNPLTSAIEAIYRQMWLDDKFSNGTVIDEAAMETILSPNLGVRLERSTRSWVVRCSHCTIEG